MTRRSILEVADDLDARGDALALMPGTPEPTEVHLAALDVMTELMALGQRLATASSDVPHMLSAFLTTIDRSRPMMIEGLAKVPPSAIRQFLGALGERIQTVIDLPLTAAELSELEEGGSGDDDPIDLEQLVAEAEAQGDQPRSDQPAGTEG